MKKRITIIGAGLAGLASAALLAKRGFRVTLIEKNAELGGRARVFNNHGFIFDMGPSWYLMPEIIEKLFLSLNHKSSDFFELRALETKYKIFSSNQKSFSLSNSEVDNYSLFTETDPNSKKGIEALIEKTSKIYDLAIKNFLDKPYHNPAQFLNPTDIINGLALLKEFNPFESYHNFVKKYVKNVDLQKIFEFHTVFLGGNPFQTPALYSMLIAADFKQKVWYPMGGLGKLVEAIEKIAKQNGVTIITNAEVSSLTIDQQNKKITAVKHGDQEIPTDIVINTSDYAYFDQNILPDQFKEYSQQYWDKQNYSISSILIYLGINKKIPNLEHHNFYFQQDWEEHFNTLKTNRLPEKPCFYICAPSKTDSSVAPKNKENLFILIPTSIKTEENDLPSYVNRTLTHVENVTGLKFKNDICYQRIYSKKDFVNDYNAYQGNALGLSHTIMQSVFMRPRMKSKHLKNLFYAGQFTQPGVGVPMVILSALYVDEILKNENQ